MSGKKKVGKSPEEVLIGITLAALARETVMKILATVALVALGLMLAVWLTGK